MSTIRVVELEKDSIDVDLVVGTGRSRAVSRPGFGASERSVFYIELDEGSSSKELKHPYEAVYYIVSGKGQVVDTDSGRIYDVKEGAVIYLTPNQGYKFIGPAVFAGGSCPLDVDLYQRLLS